MGEPRPDLIQYPRINPAFTPVVVDENEVHFTTGPWSGPVFEIVDEDREDTLRSLVSMLDGTIHIADILDSFRPENREEVRNAILHLQKQSIIRDPKEAVDTRRAKLGGYLALETSSSLSLERLSESALVVVGAGEVGRVVVSNLVDAGVGSIAYLDLSGDTSRWLESIEFAGLSSLEPAELEGTLVDRDFAVVGVDRPYPSVTSTVNEITHRCGVPWIVGQLCGLDGQVGPTVIPGETACYECFRNRATAATSGRGGYRRFEGSCEVVLALLPSFAHVVGGMVALDVIRQLAGGFGITTGSVVDYDFYDFAVQADEVLRMPRCETCGKSAHRLDNPRHVTLDHLIKHMGEDD
jgi:bacteriocin biosynthesis cyclodehydratase domain-containing protein